MHTGPTMNRAAGSSGRILALFLLLAFALSWYPWVLAAMFGGGNPNPNPLGLLLAALIAGAVDNRWAGVRPLLRGIVRWRAPLCLWLAAFGLPLACAVLSLLLAKAFGIEVMAPAMAPLEIVDRFLFIFVFIGLGEEPAWRGFLLPLLQRSYSPLKASLVVAAVWGWWHLPLMGREFAWPAVPYFLLSLIGAAVVLTWLANRSGGSLLPMIMHTTVNVVGAYAVQPASPSHAVGLEMAHAIVWDALAVLLIAVTRGRLGAPGVEVDR